MSGVANSTCSPRVRKGMHKVTEPRRAALHPSAAQRGGFPCRNIEQRHEPMNQVCSHREGGQIGEDHAFQWRAPGTMEGQSKD